MRFARREAFVTGWGALTNGLSEASPAYLSNNAAAFVSHLPWRPSLRSRHGIGFITLRSWREDLKSEQIKALRAMKRAGDPRLVERATDDVCLALQRYFPVQQATVTCVPCGHSRSSDCFAKRLARAVAACIGVAFEQVWYDRFRPGSSHPRNFCDRPELRWRRVPQSFTIVIDDVATSGQHIEETLGALRSRGVPAMGVVWISGTRSGPSADPDGVIVGDPGLAGRSGS